jgi:uncharacterized protein RhaS with RHS repeats
VGRFISKDPIRYAGGINLYTYAPNPIHWVDPLGLARKGITPNNKGTRTDITGGKLQETGTGLSTTAGGGGAHHPVVAQLYEEIPVDQRSAYHTYCGEADSLSHIAKKHDVRTPEELKDLTEGATSTTLRNDGKKMPFCPSCAGVMGRLGVKDGAV